MKKNLVAVFFALLSVPALATDYVSSFGYAFNLPQEWLILTPGEVDKQFSGENMARLATEVGGQEKAEAIVESLKGGNVEFFVLRSHATPEFQNNISTQQVDSGEAASAAAVKKLCKALPARLPEEIGIAVKVKQCGAQTLNGVRFVTYAYFLPSQGVTIVQHHIPYRAGKALVLIAGANAKGLPEVQKALASLDAAITAASAQPKK